MTLQTWITAYFASATTRLSLCIGGIMYFAYGGAHMAWSNPYLIAVCLFIAVFMPVYSRLSNKLDQRAAHITALISAGRIGRIGAQFLFNYAAIWLIAFGGVLKEGGIDGVGGVAAAAAITTFASFGAQHFGVMAFNRGYGDLNRNVLFGLSASIIVTALALAGIPLFKIAFLIFGFGIGGMAILMGLASDLRAGLAPKRGVGLYFGTFNPFHKSHLRLIETALKTRQLDRIYVHPTVQPKFYRLAIERGEVAVAGTENGMQVMEKTGRADANVDYFPAGNRFYAPDTRRRLIELALAEAGLADRVTVLWLPDVYEAGGFFSIIDAVKKMHPGETLHGIHGSDYGGMIVRSIYDECGWIYPMAFKRRDDISATAIRAGARGMTSHVVQQVIEAMTTNRSTITTDYGEYHNDNGVLTKRPTE